MKDYTYHNGVITSTSSDAWINNYHGGKENTLGISIDVEYCDQQENWVEVYVFKDDEFIVSKPVILKEGVNNNSFSTPLYDGEDIDLVRFNLSTQEK